MSHWAKLTEYVSAAQISIVAVEGDGVIFHNSDLHSASGDKSYTKFKKTKHSGLFVRSPFFSRS